MSSEFCPKSQGGECGVIFPRQGTLEVEEGLAERQGRPRAKWGLSQPSAGEGARKEGIRSQLAGVRGSPEL